MEGELKRTYLAAIKLLASKNYHRIKLAEKLLDKGFSSESCQEAINIIDKEGYLRDQEYIESRISGLMKKHYSPDYIESKICQENIPVSMNDIEEVFAEYQVTEDSQIRTLVAKKLKLNPIRSESYEQRSKDIAKLLRFLQSKGHNPVLSRSIIEESLPYKTYTDCID